MYEELIKALKSVDVSDMCPCNEFGMCIDNDCIVDQARDAIEELTEKCQSSAENNIRLIEQYNKLKNRVSQLNDHQHYSGTYIKSIMGVEEWEK